MIIMTELNPMIYAQIMELIKKGKYPSIESFVDIATKNQIMLEKQREINDDIIYDNHVSPNNLLAFNGLEPTAVQPISTEDKRDSSITILAFNGHELTTVQPIFPDETRSKLPIWGLINRFTPSKIVLRMLVQKLNNSNSEFIDFKYFANECVSKAVEIRNKIQRAEQKFSIIRGESFKIGLPKKDLKSQQRFINLYIGHLKSDNTIDGILGDLGFAAIKRTYSNSNVSSLVIGITEYGLKFSKIYSPLIDDKIIKQKSISSPLSSEEISFLIDHIKKIKPGEYDFLSYIYHLIKNGNNTPSALSETIPQFFDKYNISSSAIMNSFQIGAIGRLLEMQFIKIQKNGIYSIYKINKDVNRLEDISFVN